MFTRTDTWGLLVVPVDWPCPSPDERGTVCHESADTRVVDVAIVL